MYNNFEISLVVFMPSITIDHAITYTNNLEDNEIMSWFDINDNRFALFSLFIFFFHPRLPVLGCRSFTYQ